MAVMGNNFETRGLIVSCQALPGEPLYGGGVMPLMAKAAEEAGAIGIRTNGVQDVRAIKAAVKLPVIGLNKRNIPGSDIYITPEMEDVEALLEAGADIIALDMTDREDRLQKVEPLIRRIHEAGALVMADISTYEEGMEAAKLGADFISTTMSGYTPYSPQSDQPDLELVRKLSASGLSVPVVAEGRIQGPEEAAEALRAGAAYVVVGGAITRPQLIAGRFVNQLNSELRREDGSARMKA